MNYPIRDFDGQSEELSFQILCCNHPFRTPTVFVRSKIYSDALKDMKRDRKNAPMGDLQLFFHMSLHGKVKFIKQRTATYRQNQTSVSHYSNLEAHNAFVKKCQMAIERIAINNNHPEWMPELRQILQRTHNINPQPSLLMRFCVWGKRWIKGYYSNYDKFMSMSPQERVRFRID
jgi:hypothetical protein